MISWLIIRSTVELLLGISTFHHLVYIGRVWHTFGLLLWLCFVTRSDRKYITGRIRLLIDRILATSIVQRCISTLSRPLSFPRRCNWVSFREIGSMIKRKLPLGAKQSRTLSWVVCFLSREFVHKNCRLIQNIFSKYQISQ